MIFYNTTSPAHNQILGHSSYTDKEIWSVLRDQEVSGDTPCPVSLLMNMLQISRLRFRVATKATTKAAFVAEARDIFESIENFDTYAWSSQRTLANESITFSLGQVFKMAIRLYAILNLAQSEFTARLVTAPHTSISGLNPYRYHALHELATRELVQLLRQLWPSMSYKPALMWPLLVAGAGLAGGAVQDQEFVERSIYSIWKSPLIDCNIYLGLEKLKTFWASGKTSWDECFYEPVPC